MIEDECDIYWEGVDPSQCVLHREQFAWRLVDGKAVYICYNIYDLPESRELPLPPGLRDSRSEFGIEIILTVAFLHYWIGVSIDNAREIMRFFTGLELAKSQADSLLSQLASDWNTQYDTIAEQIVLSMIVYIDETGWKVDKRSCYTWAFSTAMHVLFRCGSGRGKSECCSIEQWSKWYQSLAPVERRKTWLAAKRKHGPGQRHTSPELPRGTPC